MDIEYRQLLVIPWSFILVKWSDCSEPKMGAKSFWRNSGQNILRFFEIINIQTEEILQNTIRINTNKTISRHNYHQIVKNKIEKKNFNEGREESKTYYTKESNDVKDDWLLSKTMEKRKWNNNLKILRDNWQLFDEVEQLAS